MVNQVAGTQAGRKGQAGMSGRAEAGERWQQRRWGVWLQLFARIFASLLGSWCFVLGFVSLGILLLLSAGLSYQDARTLMQMLGFVLLLVMFCWSYAAKSLWRLWLLGFGGGALMLGAARWLSAVGVGS